MNTKRVYTRVNRKGRSEGLICNNNNYKTNNLNLIFSQINLYHSYFQTILGLFILACFSFLFVKAHEIDFKNVKPSSSSSPVGSSSCEGGSCKKLNSPPYDNCIIDKECVVSHSTDVRKLHPGCVCDCKPGWTGRNCSIPSTFYTPLYKIEYNIKCTYVPIGPGWGCDTLGRGWSLASASTPEDNRNIQGLIFAQTWLSGYKTGRPSDPSIVDRYLFTWRFDRAAGIAFATETDCMPGAYCNFVSGQPSDRYLLGGPAVYMTTNGQWNVDNAQCITSGCTNVSCSVCQRSLCNYTVDCFKDGAVSLRGYYPSCKCKCKNGFQGKKCDTVTDPASKSDYVIVCNNTINGVVTFENATSGCKAYGDGWGLATVANAGANTILMKFGSNTAWLGGSSSGNSSSWKWLSGRLHGIEFYKKGGSGSKIFPNWAPGRPHDEACGNEKREFLTITNGSWMDAYGVNTTCVPALPKCYICERQPCVFSTDCNVSNSYNVTGYYPKCNCTCKEGWGGSTCDLNTTVSNGPYFSEYNVQCLEGLNFDELDSVCKSLGPGYEVASVTTKAANDFIANFSLERIWTGAIFDSNGNFPGYSGNHWYWEKKTRVDKHFATNSSCLNGAYCNFKPGELHDQQCHNSQMQRIVIEGSDFASSNRYWDITSEFMDCFKNAKCVACERSLCSIDLDCTTNTTDRAVGYYPDCQCICTFGYIGDKCKNKSLVNFKNYSSSFNVFCNEHFVQYEDAFQYCTDKGWSLATVPSKEAHDLISNFSRGRDIWLAGTDVKVAGEWKWSSGRLNGTAFYTNSKCVANSYCPWDSSEPAHKTTFCSITYVNLSTDYLLLKKGTGERKWKASYDDIWCFQDLLPHCYACEISLCNINLDCTLGQTISVAGNFPDCKCKCNEGFTGLRCNISVGPKRVCTNKADCHGRATNVTGVYPNCTCTGCPPGYDTPDCSPDNRTLTSVLPTTTAKESSTIIPTVTTTIDTNRTCPFNVKSCIKDDTRGVTVLNPQYRPNISLNGLASTGTNGIVVILPLAHIKYHFEYILSVVGSSGKPRNDISFKDPIALDDAFITTFVANDDHITDLSPLNLRLASSTYLINNCCYQVFAGHNSYFSAKSVQDTFEIGEMKLLPQVPLPVSDKPSTYSDDKAQKAEKELMQQASSGSESTGKDYTELFGPHTDQVVLRALSPFALMITVNDDGYSGIIISNLVVAIVIAFIHLCVMIAFKSYNKYTFYEACAAVSFPSMPIYVIYALLPGTAVAAGELVAKVSGIGFVGVAILLLTFIVSLVVPYLCLSRALFELPLSAGRIRSCVELWFPTTVIEPKEVRSMYGAMIGNIRSSMPLWPTLPLWSSILLFIFALIQPQSPAAGMALYVVLAILHCLIILLILLLRPLLSTSLNVLYVLGILPTVILSIVLAGSVGTDSYVTGTAPRVFLILFTIVNSARLAAAVASPLKVFDILSSRILLDSPVWSYTAHYFNEKKKISYTSNPA